MSPYELEQEVKILCDGCDAAGIGTWEWDFASNRVRWNRSMAVLFDADQDRLDLTSTESMAGVFAEDLSEMHERIGTAIRDRTECTTEFRIACKDGTTRRLRSHGKALYDVDGKASNFVGVTSRVEDPMEYQRQAQTIAEQATRDLAERADRMTDEFLATLSHELRTPLNAVLGWAQILRLKTKDGTDDIKRGLEAIERNARLQTQLIDDMLDMSRIITGKVRLEVQVMHPLDAIEAAIETIQPIANAKGVSIEKMLSPQAGPISADPSRLQQIIWNLLSNAVKFTPAGGNVRVVLTSTTNQVLIEIIDNGVGMTAQFLSHVFERLRQENGSDNRTHSGLGLGLAIVKQLVDLHGGTVHAASPGSGLGTTMSVGLPLLE
ncbi:MAG: ATP-binding protein [Pseudomonadota bacterium]